MSDRCQRSKIKKSFSSSSAMLQGVPQGSVLGSNLFDFYLKDLLYFLRCCVCSFAYDATPVGCGKNLDIVLIK